MAFRAALLKVGDIDFRNSIVHILKSSHCRLSVPFIQDGLRNDLIVADREEIKLVLDNLR